MRCPARRVVVRLLLGAAFALVATSPSTLTAQSSVRYDEENLLGVWQLDIARSRYRPGPPPKSETRTFSRDKEGLKGTVKRVNGDGTEELVEYRANFNQEYPVSGTEAYDAVKFRKIDSHTADAVLSHAGRVFGTARRIISDDGQTMIITFKRQDGDGVTLVDNYTVYKKAN